MRYGYLKCQGCNEEFKPSERGMRKPKYCSNKCRQRAYRISSAESGTKYARRPSVTSIADTRNTDLTSGQKNKETYGGSEIESEGGKFQ